MTKIDDGVAAVNEVDGRTLVGLRVRVRDEPGETENSVRLVG